MQANSHPQAPAGSVPAQSEAQLRLLVETGLLLASERSLDVIVQAALDAGLHLCGAHFGAFFYSNTGSDGEAYQLYKLAGAAAEAFGGSALPPAALIGSAAFEDGKIFRSNDITVDSGGDPNPLAGLPDRKLPVRSYLTVPVRGRSGEVIGGTGCGTGGGGDRQRPAGGEPDPRDCRDRRRPHLPARNRRTAGARL
jgi:GAF domain-containing protein